MKLKRLMQAGWVTFPLCLLLLLSLSTGRMWTHTCWNTLKTLHVFGKNPLPRYIYLQSQPDSLDSLDLMMSLVSQVSWPIIISQGVPSWWATETTPPSQGVTSWSDAETTPPPQGATLGTATEVTPPSQEVHQELCKHILFQICAEELNASSLPVCIMLFVNNAARNYYLILRKLYKCSLCVRVIRAYREV